ncbi:Caseinolytic peptidase B protein-like protein [Acropora cervicornis]|uniref:Caseinolytic peptidase B protein-like protein n=1 Tax=Acropora cervicornis TaxID=6130 RepID=A0AAD9VB23_ACRCE|nr:Caseinolytic peptidase B protein-like protein [Acropora cervicornis]
MLKLSSSAFPSPPSCIENGKRDWKRGVSSLPRLANVTSYFSMAAAVRLIRAKLSRLSLVFLNTSHTIVTLSSNGASRWRRLHFPPRKKLHWGIVLGTSGVLCGSVVLCSVSTVIFMREDDFSDRLNQRANFSGFTPLHYAALSDSHECVRRLIDAGADPTLKDSTGYSAVDYAGSPKIKDLRKRKRGKKQQREDVIR